jgi:hypothetical protein
MSEDDVLIDTHGEEMGDFQEDEDMMEDDQELTPQFPKLATVLLEVGDNPL